MNSTKRSHEHKDDLPLNTLIPLFDVYTALILIAEYATSTIAVEHFLDFASQLGYTEPEMKDILHDLEGLGLMTVSMQNRHKGTITLITNHRLFTPKWMLDTTNLFHNLELDERLRDALAKILPPMLKTYAELKKRDGLCNGPLVISITELVQRLNWDVRDLKLAMVSLVNYHIIDYKTNNTDDEWTISFLIN